MDPRSVDFVMVSDHYWPTLQNDAFAHHPAVADAITQFQDTYHLLKKVCQTNKQTSRPCCRASTPHLNLCPRLIGSIPTSRGAPSTTTTAA
jgi:hypothetical protein